MWVAGWGMRNSEWVPSLITRLSSASRTERFQIVEAAKDSFGFFHKRYFDLTDQGIHIHDVVTVHDEVLSLESIRAPFGVSFSNCNFLRGVRLNWAEFDALHFESCSFADALVARALHVKGRLSIVGSNAQNGVDLSGTKVGGDLKIQDCQISVKKPSAEKIRSNAAIFCGGLNAHSVLLENVDVRGRIFLATAKLEGILKVTGRISCPLVGSISQEANEWDHIALDATDANINGQAIFGEERRAISSPQAPTSPLSALGQINLSNATLGGDLIFTGGQFVSAYADSHKTLERKSEGSALACIYASRIQVDGAVFLDRGFSAIGEVRLNSMKTRGVVRCDGASIDGRIPGVTQEPTTIRSLSLRNARIGSSIFLDRGSQFLGQVDLHTANISGDIDFRGACCIAEDDTILPEPGIRVSTRMQIAAWFSKLLSARGSSGQRHNADEYQTTLDAPIAVEMSGAKIEGSVHLSCSDEMKRQLWSKAPDQIHDSIRLRFTSHGCVRLRGATIGGNFHLEGGRFDKVEKQKDPRRRVLNCQGLSVAATTFLAERGGAAAPYEAIAEINGSATFEGMSTTTWEDSPEAWPQARTSQAQIQNGNFLELNGLNYEFLKGPLSGTKRLAWLLNQPPTDLLKVKGVSPSGFKSQPWEQCAEVLSRSGYDRDAKFLLRVQHRFLRLHGQLNFLEKAYNVVLAILVGHGHRVFYAAWWSLILIVSSTIVFDLARMSGQVSPAQEEVILSEKYDSTGQVPESYPHFAPAIYALDITLPVGDFHQQEYWTINDNLPRFEAGQIVLEDSNAPTAKSVLAFIFFAIAWLISITVPHRESLPKFGETRLDKNWLTLFRQYTQYGRPWPFSMIALYGTPFIIVIIIHTLFFFIAALYLIDQKLLTNLYSLTDIYLRKFSPHSLPHLLMVAFQIMGWVLISAVIAGVGNSVFSHTRNRD